MGMGLFRIFTASIYVRERISERSEREVRGGGGWGLRAKRTRRIFSRF